MRQVKTVEREMPYSLLIVDDSEDFRSLLKVYLKNIFCTVDEAGDGEDGVELFEQGQYDLVIMDIIMPLMDGVDAICAIREIETTQHRVRIPIIALSGEDSVETGVECLRAGADRMLLKPVSRKGLLEAVCTLMTIPLP